MKCLICGAGKIAGELLKRMGDNWQVTLVDKRADVLDQFTDRFFSISKIVTGDASSPVVLEEAEIDSQDYVLALTDSDRVNFSVVGAAKERNVVNLLSLVYDPERVREFQQLGARTVPAVTTIARGIYHYLQDPRLNVISLGHGAGEFFEMEIGANFVFSGTNIQSFNNVDWRVVGVIRGDDLVLPNDRINFESGDRLLILSKPDMFDAVCSIMRCGEYHFPLTYGQDLVIGVPGKYNENAARIMQESFNLVQNLKIRKIIVICEDRGVTGFQEELEKWSESLDIEVLTEKDDVIRRVKEVCREKNVGLVVLPPFEASFFQSLTKAPLIDTASLLPSPLLLTRFTNPYEKILVPFNNSPITVLALEIAIDLAKQTDAEVTVCAVREPEFLHQDEASGGERNWSEKLKNRVRELARIHKIPIEEIFREGNPVNEVIEVAEDFNLMIVGSTRREKEIFTPNVGELIVRKSPCSVMLVTH